MVCGVFATLGIIVPLALGTDPAYAMTISFLRSIGVIGLIGGLVILFGVTGETAEPEVDPYAPRLSSAPRTLDSDPLGGANVAEPLERRLEAAIEASRRYSRTVGLVYYNLDLYRQVARSSGAAAADAAVDAVVAYLRPRLRNTDRVERLGKGRLVVCIVLLPEKKALLSIRDRLSTAMRALQSEALQGHAIVADVGMSIYPIGGYTGEDLIASAQRACDTERSERIRLETKKRRAQAAAARRQGREAPSALARASAASSTP
jgi:diguanylate cyclase (GGDEF)-like protein